MKPTAYRIDHPVQTSRLGWLAVLLSLAVGGFGIACTSEQERQDQQPTAETPEAEAIDTDDLASQPDVYAGRRVQAESTVQQVVSESGFYLGSSSDKRIFVTVLGPTDAMPEIEEKQTVRATGQVAGKQRILNQVGDQLNEKTRQVLEQHPHALVAGVDDVDVVKEAPKLEVTEVDFTEVVRNPKSYADQQVRGETTVQDVVDDRGAYLGETDQERLFSVLRPASQEAAKVDLKPRQRLRIQGAIMSSDAAENELGDQLTSELRLRIREQGHVLLAEPKNVEVLEQPPKVSVTIGDQAYGTFSEWDTDADQELSRDEFMTQIRTRNVLSNLSTDQNNTLDKEEFHKWVMSALDRDGDDAISEQEFTSATNAWQDVDWGLFEDWNTDDDQTLSAQEFEAGLQNVKFFSEWDADNNGELGPDEFGNGLFGTWDENGDGALSADEIGFGERDVGPQAGISQ